MDINATLIGQLITFGILVWFTMKYVWPPIMQAIHEREKKIAAGLEAAERGKHELEQAAHKVFTMIKEAKLEATQLIEQANVHSAKLIEDAKNQAKLESKRIVDLAQSEINTEIAQAKEVLKTEVVGLAVTFAEKIIKHKIELDPAMQRNLQNELVSEL
jgi:F-type H+-transporting ATPase subunit b